MAAQLLAESLVLGTLGGWPGWHWRRAWSALPCPLFLAMPFTADVDAQLAGARVRRRHGAGRVRPRWHPAGHPPVRPARRRRRSTTRAAARPARTIARAERLSRAEVAVSIDLICGCVPVVQEPVRTCSKSTSAPEGADRVDHHVDRYAARRYPTGHQPAAFYPMLVERMQAIPVWNRRRSPATCPLKAPAASTCRCRAGTTGCWCDSSGPTPRTSRHSASRSSPAAASRRRIGSVRHTSP